MNYPLIVQCRGMMNLGQVRRYGRSSVRLIRIMLTVTTCEDLKTLYLDHSVFGWESDCKQY
jgi:hypothetical protein